LLAYLTIGNKLKRNNEADGAEAPTSVPSGPPLRPTYLELQQVRRRGTRWWPVKAHPYAWSALGATWFIWAINAMDIGLLSVLGPSIVSEFGLTATHFGYFLAALYLLRAAVDLPISSWSDRIGSGWRRKYLWAPIVAFYTVVSVLTAIRAISGTVWSFFALRAAVNVGSVACETIGVSATSEWWARSQRGFAVGLHHTGFPLGTFMAGMVASLTLGVFGEANWRYVFVWSLLSLPFLYWYWKISTPDKFAAVYERIDSLGLERPHGEEESQRPSVPWYHVFKVREVTLASVYAMIFMAVFLMFITAFPLYLAFVGGYSFSEVAAYSVIWAISGAIFQVLLPAWTDHIGRKKLLVAAGIYAGVIMLMLPYATNIFMVFLVQVLYGVVLNAIYPICFSVCADAAPAGRVATSVSVSTTLLWLAAALGTVGTGYLIDLGGGLNSQSGYTSLFYVMSGLSLFAGLMYLFARETARPVREEESAGVSA
jgi:MFS family permease